MGRFTLSLASRIVLNIVLAALAVAGVVLAANHFRESREAALHAQEDVEFAIRVAWNELRHVGRQYRLADGVLTADGVPLDGRDDIVDAVSQVTGGVATIFNGDVRVATTVRKEDGSRAVGTRLARNAAFEAVFQQRKPYRGELDILGRRYITAYDPILDGDGRPIGVLFVGVPAERVSEAVALSNRIGFAAMGGGVVPVVLVSLWLARRQVAQPLSRLAGAMSRIAEGDLAGQVPLLERRDEVGRMAHALKVFKEAKGTREVTSSIVSVEQAARETGAAARQLSGASTILSQQSEALNQEVRRFLSEVRAERRDCKVLKWDASLEMGIPSIDTHHRAIFDEVNRFMSAMLRGEGKAGATAMLDRINIHCSSHFAEEEALMTAHRYPHLDSHRARHREFLHRAAVLSEAVKANQPGASRDLFDYAAEWLVKHINLEDRAMATFIANRHPATA